MNAESDKDNLFEQTLAAELKVSRHGGFFYKK